MASGEDRILAQKVYTGWHPLPFVQPHKRSAAKLVRSADVAAHPLGQHEGREGYPGAPTLPVRSH